MIKVNGTEIAWSDAMTLADLINSQGLDRSRVAVELNGAIIPRARFDDTLLHDDDKVEIVHFVGGG